MAVVRNPETMAPVLGRSSTSPGPRLPDLQEKLHSQTDSFLTAARLLRGGRAEELQLSHLIQPARQTCPRRSGGDPNPVEVVLKDHRRGRLSGTTAEDRETDSEKSADEVKQTDGGMERDGLKQKAGRAFSVYRQVERQKGVVCVWASGCRITCRRPRRFKAPILPVIAEM